MANEKGLAGYPSIDKPWLKYYSEEAINTPLPECTIYEYLWENNKDHLDDVALIYFGRKITYGELFENISKVEKALSAFGVKQGEIVSIISVTTPEIVYVFYALNKLGAISNWIDVRKSPDEMKTAIEETNSSLCFIYEKASDLFSMEHTQLIKISFADSMPLPMSLAARMESGSKNKGQCIPYSKFLEAGASVLDRHTDGNAIAILEHTGGTTGIAKAVALTNINVNAVVEQYRFSGAPWGRRETWLSVAFPFITYSLVCSLHLPLSLGMAGVLCFDLDTKKIEKTLLKQKINHMANTPVTWIQLASSAVKNPDYSFLKLPIVGADALDVKSESRINQYLHEHGCQFDLGKGYGMTEIASAVSMSPNNAINKLGSVGIPFLKTTISIFAPDSQDELSYGEIGEICVSGPSVMWGYYNNPQATEDIIRRHSDGREWLHTGDMGHMDEDGFLYVDGRLKRVIVDHIGYKIFAPTVENTIDELSEIKQCCVVGVKDAEHDVGQVAVAFVICEHGKTEVDAMVRDHCAQKLPEYACPKKIFVIDEFPYTGANKVDYRALEEMAQEKYQQK